jgi:putative membrane protein
VIAMMYTNWSWGAWLTMGLMMLAFVGVILAVVLVVVRSAPQQTVSAAPAPATGREHAEHVLDERFARGEIDVEEYTRRRNLLRSS